MTQTNSNVVPPRRSTPARADVVILTIIAPELEATLAGFGIASVSSYKLPSGTRAWMGEFRSSLTTQAYAVAVGCVARPGNPDAADIAGEFIQRFRPKLMMLVGIAAGIRGRSRIGDVILSSTVYAYEPGALLRRGGRQVVEPRPISMPLSHAINQDVTAYLAMSRTISLHGLDALNLTPPPGRETEYAQHVTAAPRVIEGAIASGEKLLKDGAFLTELRRRAHGRIEAGDMESAGLVSACAKAETPWLVARGVSDFGDDLKNDSFHALASQSAAAVAVDFLMTGWQPADRKNRRGRKGLVTNTSDAFGGRARHNLPAPDFEAFIGRADKIDDIVRRLRPYPTSQYSLVCIDGPGGVGKSALAIRTAYHYLETYHDTPSEERFEQIIWASAKVTYLHATGIRYRPRSSRTLEDVLRSICIFLDRDDLMSQPNDLRIDTIYRLLARQRTLLIIDNLETIVDDAVEAFIRELVAPTKALLTSRQRVDMAYPVRLQGLSLDETRDLVSRHPVYQLLEVEEDEVSQLHAATGGVPLAIYWALGLRILGQTTPQIVENLKRPDADLARFCFDEILQKIETTPAYPTFLALACAPNHANLRGIAITAGIGEAECEAALGQLEFLSLANKELGGVHRGGRRFSLPTLARMYAFGLLGRDPVARGEYFERWIAFLKSVCVRTPGAYYWRYGTYELYEEGENLPDSLPTAYAYGEAEDVFGLTNAACDYLDYFGDWARLIEICQEALEYAESLSDHSAIANCSSMLGWYLTHQNRLKEAMDLLVRAHDLYATKGDDEGRCIVLHRMSACHRKRKEFAVATTCCETALAITDGLDSGDLRALVLLEWGKLLRDQSEWVAADRKFQEVGAWFDARAARSPADEVLSRSVWGHFASVVTGRLDSGGAVSPSELRAARTHCLKSLEFFETHGGKSYYATLQFRLAKVVLAEGDVEVAADYAHSARQWFDNLGMSEDLNEVKRFIAERLRAAPSDGS